MMAFDPSDPFAVSDMNPLGESVPKPSPTPTPTPTTAITTAAAATAGFGVGGGVSVSGYSMDSDGGLFFTPSQ
jgi:hypothetical protein